MFKKTLIAAALATTASFGAVASTVTVTPTTVGVEFAKGAGTFTAATVTITTGRDYAAGDIITLNLSGATQLIETGSPATPISLTITSTSGNLEQLPFASDASATTRVRLLATDASTSGDVITVAGIILNTGAATDEGTVKFSAAGRVQTVDGPIDVDSSAAVTYITYATELATEVTGALDAVVDVNTARKTFESNATADTLVLTNTRATVASGVTTTKAVYSLYGDFSFLDENGDGDLGDTDDGSVTSSVGTVAMAADMQSLTVTDTATFASGTVGITVNTPDDVVIPDQSFIAKADVDYSDPSGGTTDLSTNTLAMGSAGAWTLNGAKAHIPFLPFGSNFSQSVTVSNTSNQTGGVDLVVYVGGDTMEVEGIATVGAEGVTDISAAIRGAVADMGLSTANLSMDVIINAPSGDITVEALYFAKSDADRLRTL